MKDDSDLVWKDLGRRELLRTAVWTAWEKDSLGPDGKTRGRYIVNSARDWVVVIPETDVDFLMVRQWRHGEGRVSLEFPGGVVDQGEDPEAAAIRELKEETGYTCREMVILGTMNPNPALFENHVHFYCARQLVSSGEQNLDSDEFVDFLRMKKQDVISSMTRPEFCHALMASALGLWLAQNLRAPGS